MRLIKPFRFFLASLGVLVLLTSAVPVSKSTVPPEKIQAATVALDAAAKDGKVTYKELRTIATDLKGGKLSLKEKIALKVFGKKISSKVTSGSAKGEKSQLVALLICAFVGGLGIHRFYLGYTWQGIVQLLTLGGCGIWSLIDFIRIILGTLKPKNGEYDTTL